MVPPMKRDEWNLTNGCMVRISTELAAVEGTTEGQRIAEDQRGVVYRMMRRRFAANAKARECMEYDGGVDDELV